MPLILRALFLNEYLNFSQFSEIFCQLSQLKRIRFLTLHLMRSKIFEFNTSHISKLRANQFCLLFWKIHLITRYIFWSEHYIKFEFLLYYKFLWQKMTILFQLKLPTKSIKIWKLSISKEELCRVKINAKTLFQI